VKLEVFFASDGDCLLLTSSDGHRALIDGGRSETFQKHTSPALRTLAEADEALDLVVVSHIDADHISGILWLMKAVAAWSLHDYQTTEGGNPDFPEPSIPRPPAIKRFWHNSWRAQLGDLAGPIEAFVSRVGDGLETSSFDPSTAPDAGVKLVDALQGLAESIPDGVDLLRIVDDDTPLPRNAPFSDLVLLRDPPHVEKLGKTHLTVIGPAKKHLEKLREEWREWLDTPAGRRAATEELHERRDAQGPAHGVGGTDFVEARTAERAEGEELVASLVAAAEIIAETDPTKVTPPNRASITLLAEEGRRTCLLTGDAAEEEILEGLEEAGRIINGSCWCNVVKVQHHGSEYNVSKEFAGTVLADQYVFCADGAHGNPDPSVVKTIVETRVAKDPRPFTIWFSCSPERALPSRRKALRAAIKEATTAARRHPQITVNLLDPDKDSVEIPV
jgi:hypothetical protein